MISSCYDQCTKPLKSDLQIRRPYLWYDIAISFNIDKNILGHRIFFTIFLLLDRLDLQLVSREEKVLIYLDTLKPELV